MDAPAHANAVRKGRSKLRLFFHSPPAAKRLVVIRSDFGEMSFFLAPNGGRVFFLFPRPLGERARVRGFSDTETPAHR